MTIVDVTSRIGWMSGGKAARWVDADMADTYAKKSVAFIERNKKKPFFLYLALHGIHVPRVPHARFKGTSQAGTRGDAIHELDDTVGQVLKTLDRLKLAKNTLVIFSSDNGGVNDDGYEDFDTSDHNMNGVLRGRKGTLFEGGNRVPFLARWPAKIKADSMSGELISLVDMPATLAALTGVPMPVDAVPDSFNVLPALLGQPHKKPCRDSLVMHVGGTKGPFAVRQGPWKFVPATPPNARKGSGGEPNDMIFNLANDLAEANDVSAKHPDKIKALQALLTKIREQGRSRPE
jgi:arylsulfatase A-like enzyme